MKKNLEIIFRTLFLYRKRKNKADLILHFSDVLFFDVRL